MKLVVELNRELNEARVIAGGNNSSEVSWINDSTSIRIKAARRGNCVEVADGIRKIDLIEQVEEFSAQLEILRFTKRKALDDRKIDVALSRPAKNIATDISDIGSHGVRNGKAV